MSNSLTLTRRNCGQYIEKPFLTDLIFVLWYFPMKWNRLETKPFRDVPG